LTVECRSQLPAYADRLELYGYVGNPALSCFVSSFELSSFIFKLGASALIGSVAASSLVAKFQCSVSLKIEVADVYVQFGFYVISVSFRLLDAREKR
jgi:hypothetical protein